MRVPHFRCIFSDGSDDVGLVSCLLDLAATASEVTLEKGSGGVSLFCDDVDMCVEVEVLVNVEAKVFGRRYCFQDMVPWML